MVLVSHCPALPNDFYLLSIRLNIVKEGSFDGLFSLSKGVILLEHLYHAVFEDL